MKAGNSITSTTPKKDAKQVDEHTKLLLKGGKFEIADAAKKPKGDICTTAVVANENDPKRKSNVD